MGCCRCWRTKLSPRALSSQYGGHQQCRMCSAGTVLVQALANMHTMYCGATVCPQATRWTS